MKSQQPTTWKDYFVYSKKLATRKNKNLQLL